jgi:acyl phosphate:glycerol-3-phosphate acyltransferase
VAALTRWSSLAALMAAGFTPVWAMFIGPGEVIGLGMVLAVLIYWRHGANIERLRAGTEPKIGQK